MLTPSLIIQKKRDGSQLTKEEIEYFISGVVKNEIPDYQASALLMAIFFKGLTVDETMALTESMLKSGERYEFRSVTGPKVDKHSTGGVGDKVSIILAPLAAACGLKVPMMSGRGLGHSGGTLDKLESITGFKTQLSYSEMSEMLKTVGCGMIGQSEKMVPADRKLYALRDVTGTVECIPLITASIVSKKVAEGTEAIVFDVKVGSGAFMKTLSEAKKLSQSLVKVSRKLGLKSRALLTNMNQPLGSAVGNGLEIEECIAVLKNENHPEFAYGDLKELTLQLCSHMLELSGIVKNIAQGRKLACQKLQDGSAWTKFQELVKAQGGQIAPFKEAPRVTIWKAKKGGFLTQMDTEVIGRILVELGGGRKKVSDGVDPSVGLLFYKKLGAKVSSGEPIVKVFSKTDTNLTELEEFFNSAIQISKIRKAVPKLVLGKIE
jgi:pyrimidine-nucleoside phosphorylase